MSKRMIDVLFQEGAWQRDVRDDSLHPWPITNVIDRDTGEAFFDQAEVLVIDNVTRYLYESSTQEKWDIEDFPNCAPPFPVFWMETRAPAYSRNGTKTIPWQAHHAWGALFIASDFPQALAAAFADPADVERALAEQREALWHRVLRSLAAHGVSLPTRPPASQDEASSWFASLPAACQEAMRYYQGMLAVTNTSAWESMPQNARWHYSVFPFVQLTQNGPVQGPLAHGTLLVDPSGNLIAHQSPKGYRHAGFWGITHGEYLSSDVQEQHLALAHTSLFPMWLAMSFLHCKNVTLTKEDPCHSRKPAKKGEQCRRLHYHVLNIQPMQEVLRREGRSQSTGLKQALHICRGHFKDYRQKGLFGKYQGLFWWDAHIRGSSREGVVVKDYNVHSTAPETADA